jgi:hypothetical protein
MSTRDRITNVREKSFEQKLVCSAVFLDIAQAFDRVGHDGLLHKLAQLKFLVILYLLVVVEMLETKENQ